MNLAEIKQRHRSVWGEHRMKQHAVEFHEDIAALVSWVERARTVLGYPNAHPGLVKVHPHLMDEYNNLLAELEGE